MLTGVFERNLRKLNPNLRIFCGADDSKPAGLHVLTPNDWEQVCGVDKGYINEYPEWDDEQHMIKGGWRRVLRLLIRQKLVSREAAQRVFRVDLSYASRKERPLPKEKKHDLMDKYILDTLSPKQIREFEALRRKI